MDRQHAEQEVTLVEVRMETESLEVSHRAKGSHDWIKCAVAFVAGLTVALIVGFILHSLVFTPSCNQDAPSDTSKVIVACKLKKMNEGERYDIFTANKAATYLIYGWLKLPCFTKEDFVLTSTIKGSTRTIQINNTDTKEVFLFSKVKLVDKTRVSLSFKSNYTDDFFHVYEL